MYNFIGLAGKKQSGKTTVGKYLVDSYWYTIGHPKAPMIDMVEPLLGWLGIPSSEYHAWIEGHLKDTEIPNWPGITPRKLFQGLGVEYPNAIGMQDIWLKLWWDKYRDRVRVIHESIRQPFEADFLRQQGGVIVEVVRPDLPDTHETHATEQHIPGDIVIVNDGSIENLHSKIREALKLG